MIKCFCKKDNTFGEYKNTVEMHTPFTYNLGGRDKDTACIDGCIASDIAYLWYNGVKTLNSCCGHGKIPAGVIVADCSIEIMKSLGYKNSKLSCAMPDNTFDL